MEAVPVVGPTAQKIVIGGHDYGHHTLTRFFALHAGLLPGLMIMMIVAHIYAFRKHGITANAIAPGAIDTPILAPLSAEQIDKIKGTIPVGRLGKPEDIAHAVLMFASPDASYITGQTIYVCGGRSLSSPSV